jgi:DNA-binding transcriptional regulator YhcF (GntR family)
MSPPSPYARIADDLRRRVEAGQLVPGERVPSTRTLARTWKVANATAAHALQALVQEGILEARPRSGTVVAGARARAGRATASEHELTRARVIAAALDIADQEGLSALSIRGLAAKLGAPTMSLYRHVRSKEELLMLMTDTALGEEKLPEPPPKGWRAQLEVGARLEWKILRRHPWLARVVHISRPTPMPNALTFANWVMRALHSTALDAAGKLQLHVLLHGFIQGLAVNVEAEAQAVGETGLSEQDYMRQQEERFGALAATGRFPYFALMMKELPQEFDIDFDDLFERGLRALLDGFTPVIERGRAVARR